MADVEVYDAAYVEALEASVIIGGSVNPAGQLVLTRGNGEQFNAGQVVPGIDSRWPVGSIYHTEATGNPADVLGGGTWSRVAQGRVLVSQNDADAEFNVVGETGGEKKHLMTESEMFAHGHAVPDHNHLFEATGITVTGGATLFPSAGGSGTDALGMQASGPDTNFTGSSTPFNILQPYYVVNIWKRIT